MRKDNGAGNGGGGSGCFISISQNRICLLGIGHLLDGKKCLSTTPASPAADRRIYSDLDKSEKGVDACYTSASHKWNVAA